MPEKKTTAKAREAKRKGKAASTQAGAFVGEEMEHYKEGKHGSRVKSRKQAIAIGLSKARRAGVKLKPPKKGQASAATRKKAERDVAKGQRTAHAKTKTSARRTSTAKKKPGPASKTSRSSSSRRSAERHRAR